MRSETPKSKGGSTHGCIAAVFFLVLIAGGLYIFYFREHGLQMPGESIRTLKQATVDQKIEYLKGVKLQISPAAGIGPRLASFISGVKKGSYRTQIDINRQAADIENRMEAIISALKGLKTPIEFAEGQKALLQSFASYHKCLKGLRSINSSAVAGNLDMIDSTLSELETSLNAGNEQLSTAVSMIRKKQKELKLPAIL